MLLAVEAVQIYVAPDAIVLYGSDVITVINHERARLGDSHFRRRFPQAGRCVVREGKEVDGA